MEYITQILKICKKKGITKQELVLIKEALNKGYFNTEEDLDNFKNMNDYQIRDYIYYLFICELI